MDAHELGQELRRLRVASKRTVASVAMNAGLSVPYIANLENGRGNPTLATLEAWARGLGLRLTVTMRPDGPDAAGGAGLSSGAREFAKSERFRQVCDELANAADVDGAVQRNRILDMMDAAARASGAPLSDLDCHRILDLLIVLGR